MAISILGSITVREETTTNDGFTESGHTVSSGTDTLLVGWFTRVHTGGLVPVFSVTWHGSALTTLKTNYTSSLATNEIAYWFGYINTPTTGNRNLVFDSGSDQRGGTLVIFNLDGTDTADLLGDFDHQASVASSTNIVELSIDAETNDNFVISYLAIQATTTLNSFTGSGFTNLVTGLATVGNDLTRTIRYKLAASGNVVTRGQFVSSRTRIGGVLLEIRAAATEFTDTLDFSSTATTEQISGQASQGFAPSAVWFNDIPTWTVTVIYSASDINFDRNIFRIGEGGDTRFSIQRKTNAPQSGNISTIIAEYKLTNGTVYAEHVTGVQTLDIGLVSLAHNVGDGGNLYVDNIDLPPAYVSGENLTGNISLATLPIEVGRHSGSGLILPFDGKVARILVDSRKWTRKQHDFLFRCIQQPDLIWGQGSGNLFNDNNLSPLALPIIVRYNDIIPLVIPPNTIDPDGTEPILLSVTTPLFGGSVIIKNNLMEYIPLAGFIGRDYFNYTVTDSIKTSTALVAVDIDHQSIRAVNDEINVLEGTSVIFDPKANDVGAGNISIVSLSTPTLGTVELLPDNTVKYTAPLV